MLKDKGEVNIPPFCGRKIRSFLGAYEPQLEGMPRARQEVLWDCLEGACLLEVGQWMGLHIWAHFLQPASRSAQVQDATTRISPGTLVSG